MTLTSSPFFFNIEEVLIIQETDLEMVLDL